MKFTNKCSLALILTTNKFTNTTTTLTVGQFLARYFPLFDFLFILRRGLLAMLISMCSVPSCSNAPAIETDFKTYYQRLGNIIGQDVTDINKTAQQKQHDWLAQFASWRIADLNTQTTQANTLSSNNDITLNDFYALPDCLDVKSLIAEKNSSLGRVRTSLSDFIYQHKLFSRFDKCAAFASNSTIESQSETQPSTAIQFLQLKQQKFNDAQNSWRELIFRGDEYTQARYATAPLIEPPIQQHLSSISNLRLLVNIQRSLSSSELFVTETQLGAPDYQPLFTAFNQLSQQRTPARLLITLHYFTVQLELSTQRIKPIFTEWTCTSTKQQTKANYLGNVFKLFFADTIQQKASAINRLYYEINPLLTELDPNYGTRVGTQFDKYQLAMREHISMWQTLFKQCQISPG